MQYIKIKTFSTLAQTTGDPIISNDNIHAVERNTINSTAYFFIVQLISQIVVIN